MRSFTLDAGETVATVTMRVDVGRGAGLFALFFPVEVDPAAEEAEDTAEAADDATAMAVTAFWAWMTGVRSFVPSTPTGDPGALNVTVWLS